VLAAVKASTKDPGGVAPDYTLQRTVVLTVAVAVETIAGDLAG
jgi:hypothetical protein